MIPMCSVDQICPGPRTPSVGLPRFPANAAHAGRGDSIGAAMETNPNKFFDKIFRPTEPNACWTWTAFKDRNGYGKITFNNKIYLAHRLAFLLEYGCLPGKLLVCHSCDNPSCVNPDHLFIGTMADNMADRDRKGRGNPRRGSDNGASKLKESDVVEIRRLTNCGLSKLDIASRFGVHRSLISLILLGKLWKHVLG